MNQVKRAIFLARQVVDNLSEEDKRKNQIPLLNQDGSVVGISQSVSEIANMPILFYRWGCFDAVKASIKIYIDPPRCKIGYSAGLNVCMARFYICKELSHLLLSGKENYTHDVENVLQLIEQILNARMAGGAQFDVENAAYFGATEMLFPKEKVAEAYEYINKGVTLESLAIAYRLPLQRLRFRLIKEVNQLFEETYKTI